MGANMTLRQPPYRTVDEAPIESDDVEQFRAGLGRGHRWAQALHRVHRAYGLVAAFLGWWRDRVRWSVDPVEAATFQAIDSLYERRSTAWQALGEATLPAPPSERWGHKGGRSAGAATTGVPSGGKGLAGRALPCRLLPPAPHAHVSGRS